MQYELEDRIIYTDISSIAAPGETYFYGSIHELNKNSGELTTPCIRAFSTKEEAKKWVEESLRNRYPNIQYKR